MNELNSLGNSRNEKEECDFLPLISEQLDLNKGHLSEESLKHIETCSICKEYFQFWTMFEVIRETDNKDALTNWEEEIEVNKILLKYKEKKDKRKRIIWGGVLSLITALLICVLTMLYFSFFNYDNQPVQAIESNKSPTVFNENIPTPHSFPTNVMKKKDM